MTENQPLNPYQPPRQNQPAGLDAEPKRGPVSDGNSNPLVVLATFVDATEAHMFRSELASHGIEARINNELSSNLLGATIAGPSSAFWIEVVVLADDVERALEIKNLWLSDDATAAADEVPEWTCRCGETVDAGFLICWNCDSEYVDPEPDDS